MDMKFTKEQQLVMTKPVLKEILKNSLIDVIEGIIKEGRENNPLLSNLDDREIKEICFECFEEAIPELKEIMKKPKKFWKR
ncbi:hypothetical protein MBCUT_06670 [Methanobrevibacter cuticularis]|uniref:Uncharacterized protein n=1 Tax=Methanobrevibacter cuticularis TaxID=47311 RepID=A0A166EGJ3_9EURY|nr:hypothetical protein [Methanobrevibacter cuticularis]KZX16629.1 hypothetical protein MBCUT_06670 [Methanobrevibacter cuticularis]